MEKADVLGTMSRPGWERGELRRRTGVVTGDIGHRIPQSFLSGLEGRRVNECI